MDPRMIPVRCGCGHAFEIPTTPAVVETPCPACKAMIMLGAAVAAQAPAVQAEPEAAAPPNLGQIAVERNWISREQLDAAVKFQADEKARGNPLQMGEALVKMGALTSDQVRQALTAQDKTPMRCPTCKKAYNVRGYKPGTRAMCKTCNAALVPVVTQTNVRASDAGEGLRRAPAGEAVDPSLLDLIAGYKIERRIGAGGMGDVYLARQVNLDRLVAVKLLPADFAKNQSYVEKFLTEAKSAAKVTHENIVASIDAGESKGRYYFVMEYVEGETLYQIVKRDGALPEKRALEMARQIAKGLRHAHKQGLIHRDVKPANVMVTTDGTAKVLDFGLARQVNMNDPGQAAAGKVESSPAYASPEQARGQQDLDHRTDMYSLGVTLYEMLTGRLPFQGDTAGSFFIQHATATPPTPKSVNPKISGQSNALVMRLLRKSKDGRFADYDELIAAVEAVLQPKPQAAPAPAPAGPVPFHQQFWFKPALIGAAALIALVVVMIFIGGSGEKIQEKVVEKPKPKTDTEADRILREARALQAGAKGHPDRYAEVRARWKELEEHYRDTKDHGTFASALLTFEEEVKKEAEAELRAVLADAEGKQAGGRSIEAILALRTFHPGYEGTPAATRVAEKTAELEKQVDERYQASKEYFHGLVAQEKFADAKKHVGAMTALVSLGGKFVREPYREELAQLLQSVDEQAVMAKKRKAEAAATPEKPADAPTGVEPPPANDAPSTHLLVLRSAEKRSDPTARAAAAAAFGNYLQSPIARAAHVFLSRDERAWKLITDRIKLKTDQIQIDQEGLSFEGEKGTSSFLTHTGMRINVDKEGKVSISGGTYVKPVSLEVKRNFESPVRKVLAEYLALVPFDRPEAMTPQQHHLHFLTLGKKMGTVGDAPVDALQLFACAHGEEMLAQNLRLDPEGVRMARLQQAKGTDVWGPPALLQRMALARLLGKGPSNELKRAAAEGLLVSDVGARFLSTLAMFHEKDLEPHSASGSWRKLVAVAGPDTALGRFCDGIATRLKEASVCAECKGKGRNPCKKCGAGGIADCDRCKGTGRVPEADVTGVQRFFSYTVPCPTCKQKGKLVCPDCGGGRIAKCKPCESKGTVKLVPAADYRPCLETEICAGCSGTGSVFQRIAFPCQRCEGVGRFPVR